MLALKDAHRTQPIYLCATHAEKIGHLTAASTGEIKSPESAPAGTHPKEPPASSNSAPNAQKGRRYRYILLLVACLALAGGLIGLRLFRASRPRSKKTAGIVVAQKGSGSSTRPREAPRKNQVVATQKRSQAVPAQNTLVEKKPPQTAQIAVKGTVAHRVLPDVPKSASETIRGTILVSVDVHVGASGNVERTKLVRPGPSRYFARLAVESAQHWKFNPPVVAKQNSPSEWVIRFYFTREATKAFATENVSGGTPRK